MLSLFMFGCELERHWGSRRFFQYYCFTGIAAGLCVFVIPSNYYTSTLGASGAIYGVLLAYGLTFPDRILYLYLLFPLPAKYFVMVTALVEFVSLLDDGASGQVANLAHIGGLVSGYIYLVLWTRFKRQGKPRSRGGGRRLKLVVNNPDREKGPKYWN